MNCKTDKLLAFLFVACIACILTTTQFGCRALAPGGVYDGQKVLYEAETTIPASYQLVNTFLEWEEANRELLQANPGVTGAADRLRRDYPKWYDTANAMRDAFIAAPSGDTEANLKKSLALLRAALNEAAKYMALATEPPK